MDTWDGWPLQRFIYLFIGLAHMMIWVQVVLFHWRGAFRIWAMWLPVLAGPLLAMMGIVFAFVYGGWLNGLYVFLFSVGVLGGMIGTYYHFRGVSHYIGGWSLRNFMVGPPPILPMTFFAFSVVALLVFFLWPGPVGGL
ncbi:MAG: hypothetical protein ACYDCO_05460 [Armatimonadota bacterium]